MSKLRTITILSILISINLLQGCEDVTAEAHPPITSSIQPSDGSIIDTAGALIESIDTPVYTYAKVDANGTIIWMAGPKTTLVQGKMVDIDTSGPMHNFHSKSLNRDFPVIYFVNHFSGSAVQTMSASTAAITTDIRNTITSPHTKAGNIQSLDQSVERAKDGHTIAELFAAKKDLAGKTVRIRGKVTKFTAGVMKHNWIHMIDGSSEKDLTVITDQRVAIDQMIVSEGTVVLDKDFGYGYRYELLLDEAKVTIE